MQLIKYRSFLLILKIMGAVSAVGVAFDVWTHNAYSALVFFHVCPKILKTVVNYYDFGI